MVAHEGTVPAGLPRTGRPKAQRDMMAPTKSIVLLIKVRFRGGQCARRVAARRARADLGDVIIAQCVLEHRRGRFADVRAVPDGALQPSEQRTQRSICGTKARAKRPRADPAHAAGVLKLGIQSQM